MAEYQDQPELKGVGGWLLTFVIILSVLSPIRNILGTYNALAVSTEIETQLGTNWQIYNAFTWMLCIASVAAMLYFAYRLVWVQNRSTVRLVAWGLWVIVLGRSILDFIVTGVLWPESITEGYDATYLTPIAQSLIFATIWSLYLTKSRRVANTYVDDEDEAKRIFG